MTTIKDYSEMLNVEINGEKYVNKKIFTEYALHRLEEEIEDCISDEEVRGIQISMNILGNLK